jgi:excisionase family DNA binding protein
MLSADTVRLYTIPETAKHLATSVDTVYRLIHDGAIRTVDIGRDGRSRFRISAVQLQEFIDARTGR